MLSKIKNRILIYGSPLIILLVSFLSWMPSLYIPFLNDDFQILGWHKPISFTDCFKPFLTPDVSGVYWRPLVNTIHSLTIWFFGISSLSFHLTNLILYIIVCLLLYYFLINIGLERNNSLLAALLFSVLPSHELQVAWIAGRGDVIFAIFIMLSSIYYLKALRQLKPKYFIFSSLSFLASLLTKELAFSAFLLPFILSIVSLQEKKYKIATYSSIIIILFILIFLCIRFFLIGGTPFESSNFYDFGFFSTIKNFFIYIPLAFVSPDQLEIIYNFYISNLLFSIVLTILFIIICSYIYFTEKNNNYNKKIILLGLFWFVIFIIPVIPLLMRWYVFTSSIGLIILLSVIFNFSKNNKTMIFTYLIIFSIIILIPTNYNKMYSWIETGKKTQKILQSLNNIDIEKYPVIYLWAVPDKIARVNSMKIGIEQAIKWKTGCADINVYSPLRIESKLNTKIAFERISKNVIEFSTSDARFLPFNGKSTAIIKPEKFEIEDKNYNMIINTTVNNHTILTKAIVKFYKTDKNILNLYFNGEEFIPF